MDLESECSVLESVEDNEEITDGSVSKNSGNISESKDQNNGSCVVESDGDNEFFPEVKQKGAEASGYTNSPSMYLKPEVSPSPPSRRKGYGLKKWKRIKRDANRKGGESSTDTDMMVTPDLPNSAVHLSKRMQYAERKQKSEASVSSTDAVVRSLDGSALLDNAGLELRSGPRFATGTDSENSEDHSSRSSTAASVPRMKYEMPVIVGFPQDKSRMRRLRGKNLTHLVQHGQQGKGWIETNKNCGRERVKIEKENSHSSVESDLQISNFVFMQGTYSKNNGILNERPKDYDGENGDEAQRSEQWVNDGHGGGCGRDGEGGRYQGLSTEDVVADSSWEAKEERSENHGSSGDQDPLAESIFSLHSVQEEIGKELLKLKEISQDISIDDSVPDLGAEFIDIKQKLQETSSEQLTYGEGLHSFSRAVQSEVVETANMDIVTEIEDLFKQKIEAEVEYLVITRTVQKLRVAAADQISVLEQQKALASEQTQILHKLGDAENKAVLLKEEAEKLENYCEDIASADEILKLQKKACKYSCFFLVQLVLSVVILGVFMFQLSPDYVEVVPT